MLLRIPKVLTIDQINHCRALMDAADWIDGKVTAGTQSGRVKTNMQLPEGSPAARAMGEIILDALSNNHLFIAAALPLKVFPPLFNRYEGGHAFGAHVDNAIRPIRGTPVKLRTDLSVTLFFSNADEYDGGELVIEDTYGAHKVKLPAGDMILYPSSSLHHVTPVTKGVRAASFFWVQSHVRDDGERTLLFNLDSAIQKVVTQDSDSLAAVELTSVYHNLMRRWADS